MSIIRVASLNLAGLNGRDVTTSITESAKRLGPTQPDAFAMGFQECFFNAQLARIRDGWLGAGQFSSVRSGVRVWQSTSPGQWACLAPATPQVHVPNFSFENSSGLALCVRGRLLETYFERYRYAQTPDRFAYKGLLVALVSAGNSQRVVITTHLNNSANDEAGDDPSDWGRVRAHQIDQIANNIKWINAHWRAPVLIIGDFNINSVDAIANRSSTNCRLYSRLLAAGRSPGNWWWDINANTHQMKPIPTVPNKTAAIDLHLLDKSPGNIGVSFTTYPADSDHLLTESQWNE